MLISIGADTASDSWGFVGVVRVGQVEAYRTLEAFTTPAEAESAAQELMGSVLGEMLAGAEWRRVREATGAAPTRRDYKLGLFQRRNDRHVSDGQSRPLEGSQSPPDPRPPRDDEATELNARPYPGSQQAARPAYADRPHRGFRPRGNGPRLAKQTSR